VTRFGGRRADGERVLSWLRVSFGLRRTDGRWRLVHQHVSAPFDMDSGAAMLDLEP
jgi:ketosteroid isomerase-like protein